MKAMQIERFEIAQFGPRLGTRMEGEQAREQLVALLLSLPDAPIHILFRRTHRQDIAPFDPWRIRGSYSCIGESYA